MFATVNLQRTDIVLDARYISCPSQHSLMLWEHRDLDDFR